MVKVKTEDNVYVIAVQNNRRGFESACCARVKLVVMVVFLVGFET